MLIASDHALYSFANKPNILVQGVSITALAESDTLGVAALNNGEIVVVNQTIRHLQTGIEESIDSLLILCEDPLYLLLGSGEGQLYHFGNSSNPAQRLNQFAELPCRANWYTPWGGPPAVRSLALSGDWIYADIHVGSIMCSPDRGESWTPVEPHLHEDVHQVATSSLAPERVYANTADAVYISPDRGSTWEHRSSGMNARYGRALAVHQQDPDCLLASISNGPHGETQCKLYRSDDAGLNWSHVDHGFPSHTQNNIDTFQIGFDAEGGAWCAVGPTLYTSADRGQSWEVIWKAEDPIRALSCA